MPTRSGRGRLPAVRATILAAAALALGGCVSVLPKAPPAQLYQFGRLPPPASGSIAAGSPRIGVVLTAVDLPHDAMGDGIVTVTGSAVAYIEAARWVTPAELMFRADAARAFDLQARRVALLPTGDIATARALLRLEVGDFEARYDGGAGAAPTVVVSVLATLSRPDGTEIDQRTFTVREPAAADRIGPIVQAYDHATLDVLGQLVAWTDVQTPATPTPSGAAASGATKPPE